MSKPGKKCKATNLPPHSQQEKQQDEDDFNFSTQSNYKKFSNFLKESRLKQQQQNKKSKTLHCNCWVCKTLDSISSSEADTLKYEAYNIVSETGDSIFSPMYEQYHNDEDHRSATIGNGKVFLSADLVIDSFFQQQNFKNR